MKLKNNSPKQHKPMKTKLRTTNPNELSSETTKTRNNSIRSGNSNQKREGEGSSAVIPLVPV